MESASYSLHMSLLNSELFTAVNIFQLQAFNNLITMEN